LKQKVVMATTHVDRHKMKLTKEQLSLRQNKLMMFQGLQVMLHLTPHYIYLHI
jgi:cyanophycinase-like exopeptidase